MYCDANLMFAIFRLIIVRNCVKRHKKFRGEESIGVTRVCSFPRKTVQGVDDSVIKAWAYR